MKIKVSELREVTNKLLDHLERTGHVDVDVDVDFYWDIPVEQRYESYAEPAKVNLGQLSDDWVELMKIAKSQAPPLNYGLVWLASILRRIGETSPG